MSGLWTPRKIRARAVGKPITVPAIDPDPPPAPSGSFSDEYETIGSEGWAGFDPNNPKLKDGTTISGTSMELYYNSSMSWAFNTGLTHTNIEIAMEGEGRGMYNIARSGNLPFTHMIYLFRLTGDLRLLDRLLDGLDAAWGSPYRTIAYMTEYWVNSFESSKIRTLCDYPEGPNMPWSPYNKWVMRQGSSSSSPPYNDESIYNGTDQRFEASLLASMLVEAAWVLHVNRNKTSPGGRNYAVEAEKWAKATVDYWRSWSENSSDCWAAATATTGNYRNDGWNEGTLKNRRAPWGVYPTFANVTSSHGPPSETMAHWYYGLLGTHRNTGAATDIANPGAAMQWAHDWTSTWYERGFRSCNTEWGPSIVCSRFWVNPSSPENSQSLRMTYAALVNRHILRGWLSGGFRDIFTQEVLRKFALGQAAAHYEDDGRCYEDMCGANAQHNCGLSTIVDGSLQTNQGHARGCRSIIGVFENHAVTTRLWDSATYVFSLGLSSVAGTYANPSTPLAVWQFMKRALEAGGELQW
jgi:hypothetical protein